MAARAAAGARYTADMASTPPKSALAIAAAVVTGDQQDSPSSNAPRPANEPAAEPEPIATQSQKRPIPRKPLRNTEPVRFEPTPKRSMASPKAAACRAFALAGEDAPGLSDTQRSAIEDAIDNAEEHGDVSLVFYNLETGKGISYDADTTVYGASSFKAPYALYVCQTQVDTGKIDLEDSCQGTSAYPIPIATTTAAPIRCPT